MKDTLIVVPVYNEEEAIELVLHQLLALKEEADILVVDDGSKDRTMEIVRRYDVKCLVHPINLGYGAALQTAYKYAKRRSYSYVVQFDADDQHRLEDLQRLIVEMRKNTADVVVGSRILGDPSFSPGLLKRIAFFWFNSLIRLLTRTKVTDPTSGLRGFSRKAFSYYADGHEFPNDFPDADTILHMLYQGFTLKEFPIGSKARMTGQSMHTGLWKHAVYMLKVTMSLIAITIYHFLIEQGVKK